MKINKKYIIFLALLIVLLPAGILLPEMFHADGAWGEWTVETIKEKTGIEPSGMKKEADLFHPPLSNYKLGKENTSRWSSSISYMVSGLIGTGIILILMLGILKLLARKHSE